MDSITIELNGGLIRIFLQPKKYRTGNTGFFALGKILDSNGDKYQIVCNVIRITKKNTSLVAKPSEIRKPIAEWIKDVK